MDAHSFHAFAESLAESVKTDPSLPNRAAVCRSAISRAYYALFLLAREFLDELGLDIRRIPNPHANLEQALANSGVMSLQRIANALRKLCSARTQADYDLRAGTPNQSSKCKTSLLTPDRPSSSSTSSAQAG